MNNDAMKQKLVDGVTPYFKALMSQPLLVSVSFDLSGTDVTTTLFVGAADLTYAKLHAGFLTSVVQGLLDVDKPHRDAAAIVPKQAPTTVMNLALRAVEAGRVVARRVIR
ncbi:MAG: hypothetical protein U0414_11115 [Polyangiaceae bacterium]